MRTTVRTQVGISAWYGVCLLLKSRYGCVSGISRLQHGQREVPGFGKYRKWRFDHELSAFDAVLPTRWSDKKFLDIFVDTCRTVLHTRAVHQLFLVVPDAELDRFHAVYEKRIPSSWKFFTESDIVPEYTLFGKGRSGWERQMEIKLAIYRNVSQKFFLTLDADNFCTGARLRPAQYLIANRAIACMESTRGNPRFFGSKNLRPTFESLGFPAEKMPAITFGWTPQLLSTQLLLDVDKILQSSRNTSLLSFLLLRGRKRSTCRSHCSSTWTEYLAYYALASHFDLLEVHHFQSFQLGIDVGTCYSKVHGVLPHRPLCLKIRITCAMDIELLRQTPTHLRPVFGVLNDHQLSVTEFEKLRRSIGTV